MRARASCTRPHSESAPFIQVGPTSRNGYYSTAVAAARRRVWLPERRQHHPRCRPVCVPGCVKCPCAPCARVRVRKKPTCIMRTSRLHLWCVVRPRAADVSRGACSRLTDAGACRSRKLESGDRPKACRTPWRRHCGCRRAAYAAPHRFVSCTCAERRDLN